ncbi:MAG: hypothetical protein A2600_13870 [Candidatus Lambdaproteobacteria bacterium RIFOXYD1_FULL_56_27]|uniref:Polyketide cyclase n=1 Tax=Candidatus Lambdaproteobacteria bacterium RIFOXYD2_FULL_56_26 TaxID=1817773 RepID=A0A1F6GRR0_9PROT|nr:MAG: hypothetical protein A2426_11115 [Candidatus Lambdaproteobacteria bacterium RIFOXYC1_FULL_56_13]OGH00877.1 MAG: hypothetical protein A2557_01960 [Candidatus Lambdaproteobacteria bacterium RIFOXYD2_FULL_56_26]OGH08704.1 MAG: hypothetical protein A2600_13870 [Candidatus Lambdaproteobacteria bacterium RIFOXYD1_FULL_56_27]
MWSQSYSKTVKELTRDQVWQVWIDINHWPEWQSDLESTRLEGEFLAGTFFHFRPKGGPNLRLKLVQVEPTQSFTDLTRFPLAKMYGQHELIDKGEELEIKITLRLVGPLGFLWRKLVVEGIARGLPEQTERLIEQTRSTQSLAV